MFVDNPEYDSQSANADLAFIPSVDETVGQQAASYFKRLDNDMRKRINDRLRDREVENEAQKAMKSQLTPGPRM